MNTTKTIMFSVAMLGLSTAVSSIAQTAKYACPHQLLTSLSVTRSELSLLDPGTVNETDRNCATKLIEKLGQPGNTEDIPLLIKFIALERPLDDDEKAGVSLHLRGPSYNFPAVASLSQIGNGVRDALIDFLKSDDRGELKTHNAVIAMIQASPEQLELVVSAMAKARDSSTGQESARLISAINFAVSTPFCKSRKGSCEAAAR